MLIAFSKYNLIHSKWLNVLAIMTIAYTFPFFGNGGQYRLIRWSLSSVHPSLATHCITAENVSLPPLPPPPPQNLSCHCSPTLCALDISRACLWPFPCPPGGEGWGVISSNDTYIRWPQRSPRAISHVTPNHAGKWRRYTRPARAGGTCGCDRASVPLMGAG